jgi:uncharacterized membrane protein YbaN (DUF454 family)
MRRVLRLAMGWLLLVLGVVGLILPVLQGWLFIALGALLLSPDVPLFGRLVCWVEERFPRLRGTLQRFRNKVGREDDVRPCEGNGSPPT